MAPRRGRGGTRGARVGTRGGGTGWPGKAHQGPDFANTIKGKAGVNRAKLKNQERKGKMGKHQKWKNGKKLPRNGGGGGVSIYQRPNRKSISRHREMNPLTDTYLETFIIPLDKV